MKEWLRVMKNIKKYSETQKNSPKEPESKLFSMNSYKALPLLSFIGFPLAIKSLKAFNAIFYAFAFFLGSVVLMLFVLGTSVSAKHKAPHYDVTPVINLETAVENSPDIDAEALTEDETLAEFIQDSKDHWVSPPFSKFQLDMVRLKTERENPLDELIPVPSKKSRFKDPSSPPEDLEKILNQRKPVGPTADSRLEPADEALSPKVHVPLVLDKGDRNIEVDAEFEAMVPMLIDMNKLAYAIGKRGTLKGLYDEFEQERKAYLQTQGWNIIEFSGKTGKNNEFDDTPGFAAYNPRLNAISIILRGSQIRADDVGAADWAVNLNATQIPFPYGGTVHKGYYQRVLAMMPQIEESLNIFLKGMTKEQKENVQITVSGHSQGAGLASIILPLLVESLKSSNALGKAFDKGNNTVRGYLISSPRVFAGEGALDYINKTIGKHNIVNQRVEGLIADPVPLSSPGRTTRALISLIPFIGDKLAAQYAGESGTKTIGYLATDWSSDVLRRDLGQSLRGLLSREGEKFFLRSLQLIEHSIQNPEQFSKETLLAEAGRGLLGLVQESFWVFGAPLHYVSINKQIEEGQALFSPGIVGGYNPDEMTIGRMIQQGFESKDKLKSGTTGRVRSAIESLAAKKAALPSLPEAFAGIQTYAADKVATGFKSLFRGIKRKIFFST